MIWFLFEVAQGVISALLINTLIGYLDLKYKAHLFTNRHAQPLVLGDKKRYKVQLERLEQVK